MTALDAADFDRVVCRVMSEDEWGAQVEEIARLDGWHSAHFRPARTQTGWRTAVSGDGKGFPDWVFIRGARLVVAELKTERGNLSPDQERWLDLWRAIRGAEVFCWRPHDRDQVREVLK